MFTGIIEELGKVKSIHKRGGIFRLRIGASKIPLDIKIGDSVSVNGVCLTVVLKLADGLEFDCVKETIEKSNLSKLKPNETVNLERALKVGDRISGHFVNGHVDCTGVILKKVSGNNNLMFSISFPAKFAKYLVEKGSVAVDGISLTIGQVRGNSFNVYIISHTLTNTNLQFKGPSSLVNLEFDILLKSHG